MTAKLPVIEKNCPVCGGKFETNAGRLSRGRGNYCSRACNAKKHLLRHGATRHGLSGTPTYNSWAAMLQRCQNPKATKYPAYGAAGVTVCPQWQTFEGFYNDMGERPACTTIDRIDGSRGYEPENCRWATLAEQQSNLRNNVIIDYEGSQWTLAELARHLNLQVTTLAYRVKNWPEGRWAEQPLRRAVVVV